MASLVGVFSDIHIHPFAYKARPVSPYGLNSRLVQGVDTLKSVITDLQDMGCDHIVFGGDLFHSRKQVDVAALWLVYDAIKQTKHLDTNLYLNVGNHDQYDKAGYINSLKYLESIPGVYVFDGLSDQYRGASVPIVDEGTSLGDIVLFPYRQEQLAVAEAVNSHYSRPYPGTGKHRVAILHVGLDMVKPMNAETEQRIPSTVGINDFDLTQWDLILSGHYHFTSSPAPNFLYIGAPTQHNWSDKNRHNQIAMFDMKDPYHTFRWHFFYKGSSFVEVTVEDVLDTLVCANKINDHRSKHMFFKLLADKGDSRVEVAIGRINELVDAAGGMLIEGIEVSSSGEALADEEAAVTYSMSMGEVIGSYVESSVVDDEQKSVLLDVGRKLLADETS